MANSSGNKKAPAKAATKTAPKKPAPAQRQAPAREADTAAKKQLYAVVLFVISVFMLCLTFIKANGVWGALRNFAFGMFGFGAFLLPLLLIYIAIMAAMDKPLNSVGTKVVEACIFLVLILGFVHIVKCDTSLNLSFLEQLKEGYRFFKTTGSVAGSGFLGAFIGGIFLLCTGANKLAAGITDMLFIFLAFMLMTGTTLIKLFRTVWKPVEKVSEYTEEKIELVKTHQEQEREAREERKKFDFDVDLGPAASAAPSVIDELIDETKEQKKHIKKPGTVVSITEEPKPAPAAETHADSKPVLLDDIIKKASQKEASKIPATEKKAPPAPAEPVVEEEKPSYRLPPIDCLNPPRASESADYGDELKLNAQKLVDTLRSFGVETKIVDICRSPSVTRYELQPAAGVKISKITGLADDLALNLATAGVRIEAPIPNKAAVGIEVPNRERNPVSLREIIDTNQYRLAKSKLNVALGRDIQGTPSYADLAKMPHLLIAGTTGSGKSVCLNTMILSILYNATPDEVKLIMIDPKKVEFTIYSGIPHLLVPVVSDPRKASGALAWAVTEMLNRYKLFSENNVRDIAGYNSVLEKRGEAKIPHIVIFIDELSDLMMAAPNEVEDSICRLAQMARAAGMHLVIATQRPSVDVITGIIKANIPSRIALSVSSQVDSRTILDMIGAEKLLGLGDMLFAPVGTSKPIRIQGCYVSDMEIETVINFIKAQSETTYDDSVMEEIERQAAAEPAKKKGSSIFSDGDSDDADSESDELLPKAIEVVVEAQMASTTLLQRKLKLGYARAARIIDELAERGIVGPFEGSKPRKVLISKQQWYEMNAMATATPRRTEDEEVGAAEVFEDVFSSSADSQEDI
ncbi:MAG: DNA translocase FtsK [Clostridiales bacterium]|nr:DNA translocase FtsK [Clostridiales bacterium]